MQRSACAAYSLIKYINIRLFRARIKSGQSRVVLVFQSSGRKRFLQPALRGSGFRLHSEWVLPAFRTLRAAPIRRRRHRRIGVCLPPFSIAAARRRKRYFMPQRFSSPCSTVSVRQYTAPLQTAVTAGTAVSGVYNHNIFSSCNSVSARNAVPLCACSAI